MNENLKNSMKKILIATLAAIMITGTAGIANVIPETPLSGVSVNAASASDFKTRSDGSSGTAVIRYVGSGSTIDIPSTINGKLVTAIGAVSPSDYNILGCKSGTYSHMTSDSDVKLTNYYPVDHNGNFGLNPRTCSITKVTLPNTVKDIRKYSFAYFYSLKSINIPNGVTSIGEFAFGQCYRLKNITIPASVKQIGNSAFERMGVDEDNGETGDDVTIKIYSKNINMQYVNIFEGATIYLYKGSVTEKTIDDISKYNIQYLPENNGSKLVNNQGVGGEHMSTWVNWNNITVKSSFKGEGGWKYKYSYKNDKDNSWVDLAYTSSSSYRLPKFTKAGNYTIRIAAWDRNGEYTSKYTYLTVKQDTKQALKDNGSKLSSTTISKGQNLTVSAKFTGGVITYRYKYAYKKNGSSSWTEVKQPKHDNALYSTDDNFTFKLPSQSGKYTVKVVCRDGKGQSKSKDMTVTVK